MKKLEKISLANIKGKLTRKEMTNIMAGSSQWTTCMFTMECYSRAPYGFWYCTGGICQHVG